MNYLAWWRILFFGCLCQSTNTCRISRFISRLDIFFFLKINSFHIFCSGDYVGGALRWEDLILYATEAGFTQPRLVISKPLIIDDADIQKAIGKARFVSAIFRCFKMLFDDNDSTKFDKPYQLTYETALPSAEEEFFFDHSLQFKVKKKNVVLYSNKIFLFSLEIY